MSSAIPIATPSTTPWSLDAIMPSEQLLQKQPPESTSKHPTWALQSSSPLLSLPGELRNKIYALLLITRSSYVRLWRDRFRLRQISSYVFAGVDLHPAVLCTCRQINSEAAPLLYSHTFTAHPQLLSSLPFLVDPDRYILLPSSVAKIKKWWITVRLDADAGHTRENVKAAFDGAEELTLDVHQAQYAGADYSMLRAFEGVRGVGRAEVKMTYSRDQEFARWLERRMMSGEKEGEDVEGQDLEAADRSIGIRRELVEWIDRG